MATPVSETISLGTPAGSASPLTLNELPVAEVTKFDAALAPILQRYPADRKLAAMLPALRLGQELFGYCSPGVQLLVANRLGVPPARAEEVASFYLMFFTEPRGKHLVEVCTNVSCALAGAEEIFETIKTKLGIPNKGTSIDGRITLREVECLASCGTAPCLQINEVHHENLTPLRALALVMELT